MAKFSSIAHQKDLLLLEQYSNKKFQRPFNLTESVFMEIGIEWHLLISYPFSTEKEAYAEKAMVFAP